MIPTALRKVSKFSGWIIISLFFSSCTTVKNHKATCEQQYGNFSQVVACIKRNVPAKKYYSDSDNYLMQQYINRADELLVKVKKRQVSDDEARALLSSDSL